MTTGNLHRDSRGLDPIKKMVASGDISMRLFISAVKQANDRVYNIYAAMNMGWFFVVLNLMISWDCIGNSKKKKGWGLE